MSQAQERVGLNKPNRLYLLKLMILKQVLQGTSKFTV